MARAISRVATAVVADVESLPFADPHFDVAHVNDGLRHLEDRCVGGHLRARPPREQQAFASRTARRRTMAMGVNLTPTWTWEEVSIRLNGGGRSTRG